MKLLTPSQPIDALIGDEEQNEKQKKNKKERNRELATLDHSVASYDPQRS